MSEHFCKDCKHSNGDGNTCTYTGAIHTTGIECPAFEPKQENEMSSGLKHTYPEGNEHEPVNEMNTNQSTPSGYRMGRRSARSIRALRGTRHRISWTTLKPCHQ
jgi:hypothetical protein